MALTAGLWLAMGPSAHGAQPEAPAPKRPFDAGRHRASEQIARYQPRFGRRQPVIAVIGANGGSELTDFVVPLGVLARAGVADVVTVSLSAGDIQLFPALRVQADHSVAEFDARFADGADYVIVPAMRDRDAPALRTWLVAQAAKGATLVSICDGAMVVAGTGLMDGKRATAHWASEGRRLAGYPAVQWQRNTRYVADGRIVSSAGISASLPVSIALVEAIAGRAKAQALAGELGVTDWSTRHDSDAFQLQPGEAPIRWGAPPDPTVVGIPVAAGVDEIALAFAADAYSHTGHTVAVSIAQTDAPVRSRGGLRIVPDRVRVRGETVDRTLAAFDSPSGRALDVVLADIAARHGQGAAREVARLLEFPYPST